MWNNRLLISASSFFWVVLVLILSENVSTTSTAQLWKEQSLVGLGPLVKKNERSTIFSTEYGDVSEAVVTDGNEPFQLHFITLEPNSLFLPVLLHYDMVFYVQTGSGKLSYLDEDEKEHRELKQGDVHRLRSGSVFSIQSDLENERQKLRVIAIFDNPDYDFNEQSSRPYSSISDLVLGFDETVLRAIFKAPETLIEEIRNGTRPGAIIHGLQKKKQQNTMLRETEYENEFMEEMYKILDLSNKHKKSKLFNINDKDPDFKNDHGWSTIVDRKKYAPFRGSKYGVFMVYLTEGSMMGPHWNPMAAEVVVPVKGKGMFHVVCPRMMDVSKCNDTRFFVEEGDLLVVPRFHAMAQMAFNNETFVFVGFSTSTKRNHPQYLAGKASVQGTLDRDIMAASLGINVSTYEKLLDKQDKSVILGCKSCAEEEWMRLMEEIEEERRREEEKAEEEARKREEEKRREEEEARKKEEEEAQRKREEEEAQKKREEEERERQEQEEKERQEKQRREEEEERKRREQQQQQEEEERERQEQQQKQEEEEREWQEQQREKEEKERQEQQRRQEEEERKRREQQQQEEEEREWQEQQREQEEKERQEQQRRQEEEERKQREQQQQEEEEEERERQEKQQKQEQEEREREQQREQEEWAAREREREQAQAQEAEREREEQAEREEEAAREQEEAEAAEGQGQAQAQEAEREREAQAEREEKAAREQEEAEAAEGQGQWGEGQEESEEEWQEQQQPEEREKEEQEEWTDKKREHKQAQARSEEETAKAAQGQEQWREDHGEQGGNQKRARRILSNI